MKKDTHLINIYLKIHHKRNLTMDDLRYLAEYAPECFEKTCQNVVYNFPAAKPVMEPTASKPLNTDLEPEPPKLDDIDKVLKNLKHLEADSLSHGNIDADKVKNLLGSLYMELLYPHNGKETFIEMPPELTMSRFDKKV